MAAVGYRDHGLRPHQLYNVNRDPDALMHAAAQAAAQGSLTGIGGTGDSVMLIAALETGFSSQTAKLQEVIDAVRDVGVSFSAKERYLDPAGSSDAATQHAVAVLYGPKVASDPVVRSEHRRILAEEHRGRIGRERAKAGEIADKTAGATQEADPSAGLGGRHDAEGYGDPLADLSRRDVPLRQRLAESLARRIQNAHLNARLRQDDTGQWYEPLAGGGRRVIGGRREAEVEAAFGSPQSLNEIRRFERAEVVQRGAQGVMTRLGQGEGFGTAVQGGLGEMGSGFGMAAKGLGYAGAAAMAANMSVNFMNSQRAANAQHQAILGGDNMEGLAERGREALFTQGMKWFGGMDTGMAAQLYEGAEGIYGANRQARNTAQDFGTQMWRKLGMDVAQSLTIIRTAAEGSNQSLGGVAQALTDVSHAARAAGMNASTARDRFAAQYATVTRTMGGAQAAQMAGFETTYLEGRGQAFSGVSLSPLESEQSISQQAAQAGMTYTAFDVRRKEDVQFAAKSADTQLQTNAALFTQQNPAIAPMIRKYIADHPSMQPANWRELGVELEKMGVDPRQVVQQFGNTTSGLTTENANAWLAQSLQTDTQGRGPLESQAVATRAAEDLGDVSVRNKDMPGKTLEERGLADVAKAVGANPKEDIGRQAPTVQAYLQTVIDSGGKRSAAIENMLKQGSFSGDTRYLVDTAQGKKEVTFEQLIQDYSDQASTAYIAKGNEDVRGQSVGKALNLSQDYATRHESGASRGRGDLQGTVQGKGEGAYSTGSVTILPDQRLYGLLQILPSGGVTVDWGGGVPTQPTPTTRPTGQG